MEPFLTAAIGAAIEKVTELAIGGAAKKLPRYVRLSDASQQEFENALSAHLTKLSLWSDLIQFKDLSAPEPLSKVFVDLDLQVTPRRHSMNGKEPKKCTVTDLHSHPGNIVLLGDVGAGKTTSLKRLTRLALLAYKERPLEAEIPLVIVLRELRPQESLSTHLMTELGLTTALQPTETFVTQSLLGEARFSLLNAVLTRLRIRLFVDGLDEIPISTLQQLMPELRSLLMLDGCRALLSCRSGAIDASFDNSHVMELRPLSPSQVTEFVRRWLGEGRDSTQFLKQIRSSPYLDTAVRPLTLAHLCALFRRYHRIPDKPKSQYRRVVRLLLEDWDTQRSIQRSTAYSNFDTDRQQEFLERIAFELDLSFTDEQLVRVYLQICGDFGLPPGQSTAVAREIESHSGLIVQTSLENYAFAHKSLHEYLTAEYLIKLPSFAMTASRMDQFVSAYAIAVSLSSDASRYFAALVLGPLRNATYPPAVMVTFLRRVVLERPDFNLDLMLGVAVLALDAHVRKAGTADLPKAYRETLDKFLAMPHVRASLKAALIHFERLEPGENKHSQILRYSRTIPLVVSATLSIPTPIEAADELLAAADRE